MYDTDTTDNESENEDDHRDKNLPNKKDDFLEPKKSKLLCKETRTQTCDDEADIGKPRNPPLVTITPYEKVEVVDVPCHLDMLVVFASPPGNTHVFIVPLGVSVYMYSCISGSILFYFPNFL